MLRKLITDQRILLFPLIIIFFLYLLIGYEKRIFAIDFVDEEDNFAIGKFIKDGEKLFTDVYTNHQPVTYIMSAGIQEITQPNTILMLVKRHREFILAWSFMWTIILLFRFGPKILLFVIPYELSRFYFLGNLFLAETIIVFPCIYLLALLFKVKQNISETEYIFIGIIVATICFSLLPMVPFTLVVVLALIYLYKPSQRKKLLLLGGFISVIFIISFFSSMENYVRDTIYANGKYYIPSGGDSIGVSGIRSLLNPLLYLANLDFSSQHVNIIKIFSFLFISNLVILVFFQKKRYYILLFILLGLINLRSFDIKTTSFHILPWFATLIFLSIFTTYDVLKNTKKTIIKMIYIIYLVLALITVFYYTKGFYLDYANKENDAYIHFSVPFDYAEAVRIMKNPKDRLFTIYNGSLVYWYSGIDHATPAVFYYPWMQEVPYIRNEVDTVFSTNPPEFFIYRYGDRDSDKFLKHYERIFKDGYDTYLYVSKKKKKGLTKEQYKGLEHYRFSF